MSSRIAAFLFLCLVTSGTASAAPVASVTADVDGDGKHDVIELGADGVLTIGTAKVTVSTSARRLLVGKHAGKPVVVAIAETEAFVIVPDGKTWKVAAKTPVGGVGLDADYSQDIAVTSIGVIRYQARTGLRRCDGKPALLFAEGFTGKGFARLSSLPVEVEASAPVIAAKLDQGSVDPVLYRAAFASHEPGSGDAGGLGSPKELVDGKLDTLWREELAGSAGEGQLFTFEPAVPSIRAKQLRIVPGNPASAKTLRESNRPKRIAVVGAKAAYHVDLPDATKDPLGSVYAVDLPQPIDGCVTVIIEDTYGPAKGTTAIAELSVIAENESSGAEALLAKIVVEGKDTLRAEQQLARRGAAAAHAIGSELANTSNAVTRRRLLDVLVNVKDPATGPILVNAIQQRWISGALLSQAVVTLTELGMSAQLATIAASPSIELDARIIALRGIQLDPAGVDVLVELAGEGPFRLRRAIIDRLAGVPADRLVALAALQTDAAEAGDIWRAATRRAHGTAAERPVVVSAMLSALRSANDYDRRYRLIDGVATLGDADALRALRAALRALPQSPLSAAVRQVAIDGLEAEPRPEGLEMILELATDSDPGVRLAALDALAHVDDDPAGPWHAPSPNGIDNILTVALAKDGWTDVRRRAAAVLGNRCQRPGPASALEQAALSDPTSEVRGDALDALVTCKAPRIAKLLVKIWNEKKMPIELRVRAVALAAKLEDPELAKLLVTEFARWRSAAIESEAAVALARRAAGVLGTLGPPGAIEGLMAALGDEAFPEIVIAAANGLATLGPKCPASAKRRLETLEMSDEGASRAVRNAAKMCGARTR